MSTLNPHTSLALLTDLYQLTMGAGYFKALETQGAEAVFHLFFRRHPFKGAYTVAAGLSQAIEFMKNFRFTESDIEYLAQLEGNNGEPLFEDAYLQHLLDMRFSCDVHAIPEGNVVFPHQPLLRIQGPIIQCQLLETALLNIINFQTLIATKSMRICQAAQGEPVLEFGLRRAQGINGALSASRAAYIGGAAATSNVLAGKLFNIPVKGTHAHSWVMSFDNELQAFIRYAEAMPANCVFLVDTFDTIEGVKNAIKVGKALEAEGYQMNGIRLDSGDLAELSIEARKMLDAAAMPYAQIVASNDLDEYRIDMLKRKGAQIRVWGVGTRLATAYDQPALGGVYKIAAIRYSAEDDWEYKVKLSEQLIKVSNPGVQQVRRFFEGDQYFGDLIYNEEWSDIQEVGVLENGNTFSLEGKESKDLLQPIFKKGKLVYIEPQIEGIREFAQEEIQKIPADCLKLEYPKSYPSGLEKRLHTYKTKLVNQYSRLKAKGKTKS